MYTEKQSSRCFWCGIYSNVRRGFHCFFSSTCNGGGLHCFYQSFHLTLCLSYGTHNNEQTRFCPLSASGEISQPIQDVRSTVPASVHSRHIIKQTKVWGVLRHRGSILTAVDWGWVGIIDSHIIVPMASPCDVKCVQSCAINCVSCLS